MRALVLVCLLGGLACAQVPQSDAHNGTLGQADQWLQQEI